MVPAGSMAQMPARVIPMGMPVQMPGVIMTPQPATRPVETPAVPMVSTTPATVSKAASVAQVPQMTPVSSLSQVTPVAPVAQVPQMTPVSSLTQVSQVPQVSQVVPKAAAPAPKSHPQLNLKPHTGSRRGSIEKPRGLTDEQIRDMVGELRARDA